MKKTPPIRISLCLLFLATIPFLGSGGPPVMAGGRRGRRRRARGLRPPFVGTQGEGNTYPGAVAPFGMIQLSPDTDKELWETASGYEYSDSSIIGFSLTHLNGTGIPDLGDILFTSAVGTPKFIPGSKARPDSGYRSPYSHGDESASPGYYRVRLRNSGVTVELTARTARGSSGSATRRATARSSSSI